MTTHRQMKGKNIHTIERGTSNKENSTIIRNVYKSLSCVRCAREQQLNVVILFVFVSALDVPTHK